MNHGAGNWINKHHDRPGIWREILIYRSANSPESAVQSLSNDLKKDSEVLSVKKA